MSPTSERLREALAEIFPTATQARIVCEDVGLSHARIALDGSAAQLAGAGDQHAQQVHAAGPAVDRTDRCESLPQELQGPEEDGQRAADQVRVEPPVAAVKQPVAFWFW